MADAVGMRSKFWIKDDSGVWTELAESRVSVISENEFEVPEYVGMDLNIEISGEGEIDKLSLAEWLAWGNRNTSPSPWADDLSLIALARAANALEDDCWPPIDGKGRLPYAAWI